MDILVYEDQRDNGIELASYVRAVITELVSVKLFLSCGQQVEIIECTQVNRSNCTAICNLLY